MLRFEATQMLLRHIGNLPIVSNLGPTTDELWHAGHRDRNFYTYGNMGLCSSIALGMAVSTDEKVVSLDGDGSLLMNLGTIATIGREQPKNLVVVVWDNEQWAQTGHQSSTRPSAPTWSRWPRAAASPVPRRWTTWRTGGGVLRGFGAGRPWFIVAKIEETEYMPVAPIEPEMTLYRFRESFGVSGV